jgi:hypothetical protein
MVFSIFSDVKHPLVMKQVPAFPYMNARLFRLVKYTLTLIVPGEVKVDLTKFDVKKFLTKFFCTKD